MSLIGVILSTILRVFIIALIARLILDYARTFAPQWRPRGVVLAIAEFVFAITDPPMNFVRRFIPPLRIGPIAFDLGFIFLFFGAQILSRVVAVAF